MNFAFLLKQHQNRFNNQQQYNSGNNKIKINCDGGKMNTIIFDKINNKFYPSIKNKSNNYQTLKEKKTNNNNILKFIQIYNKFQDDPTTQWILQQDNYNLNQMKLHKFKPTKVKIQTNNHSNNSNHTKNSNHSNNNNHNGITHYPQYQSQSNHYPISNKFTLNQQKYHYPNSINHINNNRDDQSCQYSEEINHQNLENTSLNQQHHQNQRKNYSPMHRLYPKSFNKVNFNDENKEKSIINKKAINNKVSFADDQMWKFDQNNEQNEEQANQNKKYKEENQRENQIKIQQDQYNQGINLLEKFNQSKKQLQIQDIESLKQSINDLKRQPNTNTKQIQMLNEPQSIQRIIKNSKQPQSLNFGLEMGISFKEFEKNQLQNINKFCQSFNIESQEAINNNIEEREKDKKKIEKIDEFIVRELKQLERTVEAQKEPNDPKIQQKTSIKIINFQEKNNKQSNKVISQNDKPIKTIETIQTQPKRDRSPNHIVCRANIKTLTPEKYQIYINLKNQSIKGTTQNFINLKENGDKVKNAQIEKGITNLRKNQSNQDRINRIVIFDSKKKDNAIEQQKNINLEKTPELKEKLSNQPYQTNKLITQFTASSIHPISSQNNPSQVNEPNTFRSPTHQKTKCSNQLAILQTEYNSSEKPIISDNITNLPFKPVSSHHPFGIPINSNIEQVNITNNYAYRPLGMNGNVQNNLAPYSSGQQSIYQPKNYQTVVTQPISMIQQVPPQLQNYNNQLIPPPTRIRTYSPYFPVNPQLASEQKRSSQTYQPYTFLPDVKYQTAENINQNINFFPPQTNLIKPKLIYNFTTNQAQINNSKQAQLININPNFINNKPVQQQKENDNFLKVQGIKQVESKIYEAPLYQINSNMRKNIKQDPKQASIEFSLRSGEPFEGLKVISNIK